MTLDFAVEILKFCEILRGLKQYDLANQLMRSGTSPGAHVFEAQHAESKADFIHKMKGAVKETSEALFWIIVCERSDHLPTSTQLRVQAEGIITVISRIILTAKASR
ncbi:four helix bundle protein [Flavihumibacter rivuli]|nr:four helix bundle protein [Flavihumibacter rivuli]ULQ58427.1 four helix bundle protein [Flavihumibacter rivuli]